MTAQIAAFAQQLEVHASATAYESAQAAQGLAFARDRSFPQDSFRQPASRSHRRNPMR